jgi:hypothetical protein
MLETGKLDLDLIQENLQPINKQLIQDSPLPQAATAAAKFARPSHSELTQQLKASLNLHSRKPSCCKDETLGLVTEQHPKYSESVAF